MPKERYMALLDLQTVWTGSIKPFISQTFAKQEDIMTSQQAESLFDEVFGN